MKNVIAFPRNLQLVLLDARTILHLLERNSLCFPVIQKDHKEAEHHHRSRVPAAVQDSVGAGDAFAAAFLHGYHYRWPIVQTARFANALGAVVASRAATPHWTMQECPEIVSATPTT